MSSRSSASVPETTFRTLLSGKENEYPLLVSVSSYTWGVMDTAMASCNTVKGVTNSGVMGNENASNQETLPHGGNSIGSIDKEKGSVSIRSFIEYVERIEVLHSLNRKQRLHILTKNKADLLSKSSNNTSTTKNAKRADKCNVFFNFTAERSKVGNDENKNDFRDLLRQWYDAEDNASECALLCRLYYSNGDDKGDKSASNKNSNSFDCLLYALDRTTAVLDVVDYYKHFAYLRTSSNSNSSSSSSSNANSKRESVAKTTSSIAGLSAVYNTTTCAPSVLTSSKDDILRLASKHRSQIKGALVPDALNSANTRPATDNEETQTVYGSTDTHETYTENDDTGSDMYMSESMYGMPPPQGHESESSTSMPSAYMLDDKNSNINKNDDNREDMATSNFSNTSHNLKDENEGKEECLFSNVMHAAKDTNCTRSLSVAQNLHPPTPQASLVSNEVSNIAVTSFGVEEHPSLDVYNSNSNSNSNLISNTSTNTNTFSVASNGNSYSNNNAVVPNDRTTTNSDSAIIPLLKEPSTEGSIASLVTKKLSKITTNCLSILNSCIHDKDCDTFATACTLYRKCRKLHLKSSTKDQEGTKGGSSSGGNSKGLSVFNKLNNALVDVTELRVGTHRGSALMVASVALIDIFLNFDMLADDVWDRDYGGDGDNSKSPGLDRGHCKKCALSCFEKLALLLNNTSLWEAGDIVWLLQGTLGEGFRLSEGARRPGVNQGREMDVLETSVGSTSMSHTSTNNNTNNTSNNGNATNNTSHSGNHGNSSTTGNSDANTSTDANGDVKKIQQDKDNARRERYLSVKASMRFKDIDMLLYFLYRRYVSDRCTGLDLPSVDSSSEHVSEIVLLLRELVDDYSSSSFLQVSIAEEMAQAQASSQTVSNISGNIGSLELAVTGSALSANTSNTNTISRMEIDGSGCNDGNDYEDEDKMEMPVARAQASPEPKVPPADNDNTNNTGNGDTKSNGGGSNPLRRSSSLKVSHRTNTNIKRQVSVSSKSVKAARFGDNNGKNVTNNANKRKKTLHATDNSTPSATPGGIGGRPGMRVPDSVARPLGGRITSVPDSVARSSNNSSANIKARGTNSNGKRSRDRTREDVMAKATNVLARASSREYNTKYSKQASSLTQGLSQSFGGGYNGAEPSTPGAHYTGPSTIPNSQPNSAVKVSMVPSSAIKTAHSANMSRGNTEHEVMARLHLMQSFGNHAVAHTPVQSNHSQRSQYSSSNPPLLSHMQQPNFHNASTNSRHSNGSGNGRVFGKARSNSGGEEILSMTVQQQLTAAMVDEQHGNSTPRHSIRGNVSLPPRPQSQQSGVQPVAISRTTRVNKTKKPINPNPVSVGSATRSSIRNDRGNTGDGEFAVPASARSLKSYASRKR